MWRYKNANTGHVVDLPERDASLDMLPNWSAVPLGPAPELAAAPAPAAASAAGAGHASAPGQTATTAVRPPESANKAAWIAYAVARGMAEADARALRKDALIEEFGENADNEEEEGDGDGQD